MAVADVFTALAEDRPYREGLPGEEILALMNEMATGETLDRSLVTLLQQHYDTVSGARLAAQTVSRSAYQELLGELAKVA
jgi:HD-GYP domain-containing protein (c-di-GMP phosphodiesterase class II)